MCFDDAAHFGVVGESSRFYMCAGDKQTTGDGEKKKKKLAAFMMNPSSRKCFLLMSNEWQLPEGP